ncbi:unnamed protein product [Auanema sp. JU1783]|nr:unnamed protein product [Auanema sp. JU1783]
MVSDRLPGQVIIYTVLGNAQCMKAKNILNRANIPYTDVSLDSFPQCREEVIRRANGDLTVPQIFFNHIHIGGTDQLQYLVNDENAWDNMMAKLCEECSENEPPIPLPTTAVDYNDNKDDLDCVLHWMPDEYDKLISDMRKSNLIRDNKVGLLKTYRNSFKGEELIEWMVREKGLQRREALEIGQDLIDRNFGQQASNEMGTSFSPDRFYQLVEDDQNRPLNYGIPSKEDIMTVAEFNNSFVKIINPVLNDVVSEDGITINYQKLIDNDNYTRYLHFAKDLRNVDPSLSSPDERIAFFVNVYNVMLIHMTHKYGLPQSVWQRRKYINSTYYQIHEHKYSLQSILNGILRSNRKGLGMLWKSFGKQDERLPLILPECEPLVHFCLTSGTRSTPPIRTYTSRGVRKEMEDNARIYLLNDNALKIDAKKNMIYLTKIFKWYADDFGSTHEKIISWILQLFEGVECPKIKALQTMFYTGDYTVDYLSYDWTFNGKEKKENRQDCRQAKDCPNMAKEISCDFSC